MAEPPEDARSYQRRQDQELTRVRDHLHELTRTLQEVLVRHGETKIQLTTVGETLESVKTLVQLVPQLDRRIWLLERIVFGVCGLLLAAVIVAMAQGVIIFPFGSG